MTDQRDLDRLLGAFLAEGADELPDRVIDAALEEIDKTQQRRAARQPWRFSTMNTLTRLAAAAVLAVVAVGGTLYLAGLRQPPAVGPSPTPGASVPTASPTSSAVPSVSPEFAYIVGGRTGYELWVANLDGTGAHELIPGLAQELNPGLGGWPQAPVWSDDGTRLLFTWAPIVGDMIATSHPEFGPHRFYLTDASGKAPQLVDTGCVAPCTGDGDAAFSRDGTHLVFVRSFEIPPTSSGINPATGKQWGPTPASVLATIDLATGRVTELPSTTVLDCPLFPGQHASGIPNCAGFAAHNPRWSPDGGQIVFSQDVPYDINAPEANDFINGMPPPPIYLPFSLFAVDADGQNLHQISTCCQSAEWSPDGARIVFESGPRPVIIVNPGRGTGYTFADTANIYTVRPDGSDLRQLTSDGVSHFPVWTAGGQIWFVRPGAQPESPAQLWVMDADGSDASQLSPPPLLMAHWPISAPAAAMTADNLNP